MINFRFHLVSLIAVFLALALGVVVGSTVIDRAIVDGLEAQIDRVERNVEDQREENGRLRGEVGEMQAFSDQSAAFAVQDRLSGVPVAVLALRGADEEATRAVVEALRQAGAVAPAVLWLQPSWAVEQVEHRRELREIVGLPRADAETVRAVALEQLATRLAAGEAVAADPSAPAPDVLSALVERGFVEVDRAGGTEPDLAAYPGVGARVMVVAGAEDGVGPVLFPLLLRALADATLPALGVGLDDLGDEPGPDLVGAVRSDDQLADRVSTLDSARGTRGHVAAVLALDELGRGEHGHYGSSPGSERRLPEPAGA